MIITIYEKSRKIQNERLEVFIDNRDFWRIVNRSMKIANYYNQDRVAEATAIKKLIDKCKVAVEAKRILVYREIIGTF